jgi:ADP-ribose pyrophosphatase YjhB (NUDIX family)
MSCFNGAAEIGEITYLVELFEDAVTMIDRRVRYYLAQLSRSPDSTNGQWWSAPHSHAVSRFTSDLRTDSLTLAGLLWIDTFPQRPDTDRGTDPDLDPALPIGPQLLDREVLFKGRWFSIVARSFAMESSIRPDEIVRDRQIVRRADTVLVLPVQGQRAITLREYIAGVNGHPPGLVGGHAQQGLAAPMVTAVAHREMREECGMSGRLVRLASTYGSPDLTRTVHHFLATRLFHDPLDTGAEDHDVRARWDELGDLVPGKLLNDFVVSEVATVLLAARELSGH